MVMTTCAFHSQPHEAVARRHHAVIDAILPKLLGNRAPFERHAVQSIIGRGHPLVLRRMRE